MSWSTQPIRFGGGYTVALAPHFQGPRPKDRGSVGSALVCRWPPGGVSGALRPPQSPQDSGETSLTSLWQPHRKVKQRGEKVRISGLFLEGRVRRWTQNPPIPPFVSFPGFPLTRVADSVCTWWDHAFEGSRSPWPTTRAPTPELANSRHPLYSQCTDMDGAFDEHTAGCFVLEQALVPTFAHALAVFFAVSEGVYTAATSTVLLFPVTLGIFPRSPAYGLSFPLRLSVIPNYGSVLPVNVTATLSCRDLPQACHRSRKMCQCFRPC